MKRTRRAGASRPPCVLIAPNAFKASLTVLEAAAALEEGVRAALPGVQTRLLPLSDGGDGLIEALLSARGGRRIAAWVRGPLGERRRAHFALLRGKTAVVEMARASGLALVPPSRRDPLRATSYGTGQLIKAALKSGARTILVGMGGSATNDGGSGMAQALGWSLLDDKGRELEPGAGALLKLSRIERGSARPLKGARVIAVSDVTNPLLGPEGSARVYGPQKGATPEMVDLLERALGRYARILARDLHVRVARLPGAGAAGGLGAGLAAFLGARIVRGSEFVLREIGARSLLRGVLAAVTGEGRLDKTSFYGKAPIEFSRLARSLAVPVAAVCGSLEEGLTPRLRAAGILSIATLPEAGAPADSMARAAAWAAGAAALAVKRLLLACAFLGFWAWAGAVSPAELSEVDRLYFHREQGQNLEESLSLLEGLLSQEPRSAALLWRQGRSLVRLGERLKARKERLSAFERAEESLRLASALDPREAEARFWLGVAMGRRGQTRGILRSLFLVGPIRREMRAALSLDPGHGGAHHVLGEIYLQLPGFAGGDKKAGARELEEAVRLSPNYTANYPTLAEAYLALGEREKAVAVLRKVSEVREPSDPAEYPDNLREARELLKRLGAEAAP